MKIIFVILLFSNTVLSQIKLLSWNIENFGSKKSDSTITYIATVIKNYDVIALQEIVAGDGGAQAVTKLVDELNRKGNKWDYVISNPTFSSSYKTERYSFIWKTSTIKLIGKPWLEEEYKKLIDREPYFATFSYKNNQFALVNYHAITQSKQPETEIKYFKFFPKKYNKLNLIFIGDFNCPQSHTVFNPLRKMEYLPVFTNQKTSLKSKCNENDCLSKEFDNIWYNKSKVTILSFETILFFQQFEDYTKAKEISDHIPITAKIALD